MWYMVYWLLRSTRFAFSQTTFNISNFVVVVEDATAHSTRLTVTVKEVPKRSSTM